MTATNGKTVLVCGGTTYAVPIFDTTDERLRVLRERAHLFRVLDQINAEGQSEEWRKQAVGFGNIKKIVACGLDGASLCAGDWAVINWNAWDQHPPDFQRYGARAIEERNRYVFEEVQPDLMVVFPGEGSEVLLAYARKYQVKRAIPVIACCSHHPLVAELSAERLLQ